MTKRLTLLHMRAQGKKVLTWLLFCIAGGFFSRKSDYIGKQLTLPNELLEFVMLHNLSLGILNFNTR